jgi:F-type H+-transporting ATPase subunit gamma
MATQKEVKNRIASVKNINKITRAMEMVAAARLRRAEQRIEALRPYAEGMRRLTRQAAEHAGGLPRVPVLMEHEEERRVGVVLITGDRGLAGAFNTNIIRDGMRLGGELRERGVEPDFSAVGRKGVSALTFRKQELSGTYIGFTDRPAFANAREIGEELTARYVDGALDRVELVYNRYVSPLTQHVWRQTLLPMQQAEVIGEGVVEEEADAEQSVAEKAHAAALWEYEPEAEDLLAQLIPEYVNISSAASELGARMTAMRNAAENAETMMDDLTLEMNRVRQSEITQEILEVVAGAEALG